MTFFTMGVFGFKEEEFFSALLENEIDVFIDIRQRRGIRGTKYKFVNISYLQKRLEKMNIRYIHFKELAPSVEIRNFQKETDRLMGKSKYERTLLSDAFIEEYNVKNLSKFNSKILIDLVNREEFKAVLFCVEATPQACHRGLVANFLEKDGYRIKHIIKGE